MWSTLSLPPKCIFCLIVLSWNSAWDCVVVTTGCCGNDDAIFTPSFSEVTLGMTSKFPIKTGFPWKDSLMDKTESEWMFAAEGQNRGVVETGPLRTFSCNKNCPGRTAMLSGFSYGWYRMEASESVVAALAVESANLVWPFSEKSSIRRESTKSEEGIGFCSEEWGRDPFPAPFSFCFRLELVELLLGSCCKAWAYPSNSIAVIGRSPKLFPCFSWSVAKFWGRFANLKIYTRVNLLSVNSK